MREQGQSGALRKGNAARARKEKVLPQRRLGRCQYEPPSEVKVPIGVNRMLLAVDRERNKLRMLLAMASE